MHDEMPQPRPEGNYGFQLWVNLPAKLKMSRPRYQDIRASDIPEVTSTDGARVRVIAGEAGGVAGPVTGIAADPVYLDVLVPPHGSFTHDVARGHSAFSYVFEGAGSFGGDDLANGTSVWATTLAIWGDGDYVNIFASESSVRFLLISGKPLNEPIARYGPFVMNTRAEIEQALRDLREGAFVWSEERGSRKR